MGGVAFVFAGQGDQYPGMGKALYDGFEAAASVFRLCESLRPGTMAQCFEGTVEELQETVNTQPCLYAMELAAAAVLLEKGIRPDAAAGFSLGEVAAAAAAGLFDVQTGFKLVCKRGELMQAEAGKHDTSMAAVLKLTSETVTRLCEKYPDIYPVNFNCPGQTTVSGMSSRMPQFFADVKTAGGRALPLKVRGAFHSPFMREAAKGFALELAEVEIQKGRLPLYSNVTAQSYDGDAAALLSRQIASPVRWEALIRNMIVSGIDTFIEIGPGKTLSNMIRKIDTRVRTFCVSELDTLLSEVGAC